MYKKFSKWVKQGKIDRILDWLLAIAVVSLGIIFFVEITGFKMIGGISTMVTPSISLPSSTEIPKDTPTDTPTPILFPCGPGQHSGQYVYLTNTSDCQNYTDCGFNDGSWKLMTISACKTAQANSNSANDYQDYGWYMHNGQSMQYVNGQWFLTPQQGEPNPQSVTQNPQQNSNTSNLYLIDCTLSTGTYKVTPDMCIEDHQLEDSIHNSFSNIPPPPTLQPTPIIYTPPVQGVTPLPNIPTPLPPCTEYDVSMHIPCQP